MPPSSVTDRSDLLAASPEALGVLARARRDALFGRTATYSPKVFIPLTELCRDRCGYCTFAKAPARLRAPYLSVDEVLELAHRGEAAGCTEALFTLGERPELRYADAASWLADHEHGTTVEYLAAACAAVVEQTSLLPHANAGALFRDELATLRPVAASQGMMLETLRDDLECHRLAPDKAPASSPSRSPPGCSSASARTARTAWWRCRRSPTRTRGTATSRR